MIDFSDPIMTFRSTALLKKPRKRGKRNRIATPEDLLQSDVIYGLVDGSILQRVMRTAEDPLLRGMWARMQNFWPTAFVQSVQEGIERTRRQNYGFIVDTPLAEYLIGQQPCDLYAIEPFLSTRRYAIAMRRNDPLIAEINGQLRLMHEREIMSEFYLKWWRSSCDLYVPRNEPRTEEVAVTPTTKSLTRHSQMGHRSSGASRNHDNRGLLLCILAFWAYFYSVKYRWLHEPGSTLDT